MLYRLSILLLIAFLSSCTGKTPVLTTSELPPPAPPLEAEPLAPASWQQLQGWNQDQLATALQVFQQSCKAIERREQWQTACEEANTIQPNDNLAARNFFESYFLPYQVQNEDGSKEGLITGYYGPELAGSRVKTDVYRYPIYAQPDDLLTIDLDEVYPELGAYRLRGRVVGNRVVPYFERGEIDNGDNPLAGNELFWVKDPVDLFFLHIQGSGRIRLPNGKRVMVSYANQNGRRYRSIGKLLLERHAMTRDQMSMQNIRRWVNKNPEAGKQLLAENPSYVFFRELPPDVTSPPGSLGVPLTAQRSLAVDPRTIPLGAPVFLSTTVPGCDQPLQQLMIAQDTGGAIKGRVRADFFWGMGQKAGEIAGKMKQPGRMWVLLPKVSTDEQLQSRVGTQPSTTGIN